MSELFEVATWLIYALAAVMMLTVIAAAILAGLALGVLGEFCRSLVKAAKRMTLRKVERIAAHRRRQAGRG